MSLMPKSSGLLGTFSRLFDSESKPGPGLYALSAEDTVIEEVLEWFLATAPAPMRCWGGWCNIKSG